MTTQQNSETVTDMAGEYVLGTMSASEREEFTDRLLDDRQLQAEVASWERRLNPLLEAVEPVQPAPEVWHRLEQRIDPQAEISGLWNSLGFWRNLGLAAASAVIMLSLTLTQLQQGGGEMERMLVVMNDRSEAGWIVSADHTVSNLKVQAVAPTELPSGKFCQLWMESADGHLMPVGVLPHSGSKSMVVPTILTDGSRFRVSIEQPSNQPLQQPSDEIVFNGPMIKM